MRPEPGQQRIWIKRDGRDKGVQLLRRNVDALSILADALMPTTIAHTSGYPLTLECQRTESLPKI